MGAEVQRLAMVLEALGEFRRDEHAADGVARHFSSLGRPLHLGGIRVKPRLGSASPFAEYLLQGSADESPHHPGEDEFQHVT